MNMVRNAIDFANALAPVLEREQAIKVFAKEAALNPNFNENSLVFTLQQRGVSPARIEEFLVAYRAAKTA